MSRSNSAVSTGPHEARFGLAISESEYQKAVHTLHWWLRTANTGTPTQSREVSYKLIHVCTKSESPKYSGQIYVSDNTVYRLSRSFFGPLKQAFYLRVFGKFGFYLRENTNHLHYKHRCCNVSCDLIIIPLEN
jgi:hypothetical protein